MKNIPKTIPKNRHFYRFALEYMTGIPGINPKKIQETALLMFNIIKKQIEKKYNSVENAKEIQEKQFVFYNNNNNNTEIFRDTKNFIYKLFEYSKQNLFDQDDTNSIKFPSYNKIKIKEMPALKSIDGPISRTYENILFLNMENLDKLNLLLLCARELIPGSLLYKSNCKPNKYTKMSNLMKDGWGLYAEDLIYNNELYILLKTFQQIIYIIIDIGINTTECVKEFTFGEAEEFINKYGMTSNNILRLIEKPGKLCSAGIGYLIFKQNGDKAKNKKKYNKYCINSISVFDIKKYSD